jgi:type IV secretion system protein VirB6
MDFVLFVGLYKYLNNEISGLTSALMDRSMHWVAAMAYLLFSLWVMFTGYRAITGTLREPLMAVAVNMAKMALIVTTACSMNFFSTDLRQFINNDLGRGINELVTGKPDDIAASIDKSLAISEIAMNVVDAVQLGTGNAVDPSLADDKLMTKVMAIAGTSSPPLTAAAMLMMYSFAMALIVGLAPLFIFCLMFEMTKPLFQRWLLYAISTLFSMAVLNLVAALVMKTTLMVGAVWTLDMLVHFTPKGGQSLAHTALQQGYVGLLLTVLVITVPPMAGYLFQGTLGNFMHFSAFGDGVSKTKGAMGMSESPKTQERKKPE